ncbi:MAG: hypothetical protein ABIQ39_12540, partial [Ilumatobacteraceae bacterium]
MNEVDEVLISVAHVNHQLVTRADIASAGIAPWRWRRNEEHGQWSEIMPGVWHHAAVVRTWELRIRAGVLWLGRDAAIFGFAAAAWWALDGFDEGPVQYLVPHRRRSLVPIVELHTTSADWSGSILYHRGVRVTSVTRTITDLAAL